MTNMIVRPLMEFGAANCKGSFFTIPTWYRYLSVDGQCRVTNFNVPGDLVLVVLAFIDILLHIAGIAAVVFVIYGGIRYVTSEGNPDATAKAQSTIVNALVGLALAIIAIVFVQYLGESLK